MKVAILLNAKAGALQNAKCEARAQEILAACRAANIDAEVHLCEPAQLTTIARKLAGAGRLDAVRPQSREEGHCLPAAVRHSGEQALATGRAAMGAGHVRLGPGLVDEHQPRRVDAPLMVAPSLALARNIGSMLLGGAQALF